MLNRLKISLILAPLALTVVVGVYVYSLWSEQREHNAAIPFDATGAMNRDLLKFHQKRGSFPETLKDLEGVIWEKKERNYMQGERLILHRNYAYMYTKLSPHRFSLWAIPIGTLRDDAPTFFFVSTPESRRSWKGPAIPMVEAEKLSFAPSSRYLSLLGLTEQSDISK